MYLLSMSEYGMPLQFQALSKFCIFMICHHNCMCKTPAISHFNIDHGKHLHAKLERRSGKSVFKRANSVLISGNICKSQCLRESQAYWGKKFPPRELTLGRWTPFYDCHRTLNHFSHKQELGSEDARKFTVNP